MVAAALLAGCGSHHEHANPPTPKLPHTLARQLATYARTVRCGDVSAATALQRRVIAAINAHRVPSVLQEELLSKTTSVVAHVRCTGARPRAANALLHWLEANR